MALNKKLKEIEDELEYWENYPAQNWLGKWGKQIRIDNAKTKKRKLEDDIEKQKKRKREN
jgi:hypothetical protein